MGYGNFGAGNSWEILITLLWMVVGVSFYALTLGSIVSHVVEKHNNEETLDHKIKTIDKCAE